MLWRRKSEGFEWHKYVRTTIKLRRRDRRQRIARAQEAVVGGLKDAGQVAVEGLKDAGQVAVEGLRDAGRAGVAAGSSGMAAAGRWGLVGMRMGAVGADRLADQLPRAAALVASSVLVPAGRWTRARLMPMAVVVDRSGYVQALLLLGSVLLSIGLLHANSAGLDSKAMAVTGLGLALLAVGSLPYSVGGREWPGSGLLRRALGWLDRHLPWLDRLPRLPFRMVGGVLALAAVLWAGWSMLRHPGGVTLASLPGLGGETLEGRATALTGDTLRLRGRTVRLSGIDAPELDQQCGAQSRGRSWRCGAAAQTSLQALVRGQTVRCVAGGSDASGHSLASCYLGDKDLAAELVRRGHAFAETGAFSTYARLESTARSAKLGLWRSDVERPSDYRARRWETASRSAPEGCPIKGQVTAEGRVYILPWSTDYARVRVREQRGERWFCSEDEARAAGWRPIERS
jgi:endonuclease YncB( thermonuclease family)